MQHVKIAKIIKSISTDLETEINYLLKKVDLTLSQGLVLFYLKETDTKNFVPIKNIEKEFGIAQSTSFGIITRLEKKDFVETSVQNNIKLIKITEQGLNLAHYLIPCLKKAEYAIFADFTEGEKILFLELLQRAEANLSDSMISTGDNNEQ
ncbi:MAG: MarR family winged helix-turn-helix transcriptional regulator [Spirochaetales bacterium]